VDRNALGARQHAERALSRVALTYANQSSTSEAPVC